MAVAAHHDLGAGAVVRGEQDERVLEGAHRAELRQHAPDLAVHAVDHRGVNRHLVGLKGALFRREGLPRQRPVDLVRAELLQVVGKIIRGPQLAFRRGESAAHQAQRLHALQAFGAERVPALPVARAVARDILGRRVQREVRHRKGEEGEEGAVRMGCGVLLEAADRMVGKGGGTVIAALRIDGRQRPVILQVALGIEIAVVVLKVIRAVEPAVGHRSGSAGHVPFARMISAVTERLEQVGQRARPGREAPFARVLMELLRVVAGDQRAACGPAAGGVVALGEAQAVAGEAVEMRRGDLGTVAADIGEAEVVGQDHQNIGWTGGRGLRVAAGRCERSQSRQKGYRPLGMCASGRRCQRIRIHLAHRLCLLGVIVTRLPGPRAPWR
ncbi:MAG: hypothetical protein BWX70_03432 [Verrucomicrobia bacterium ADurb.Bin070]|nr:MAG: hypothetical protein BWX70_03432 [Verrucomicrobia bacterium ADurb.Bin070]